MFDYHVLKRASFLVLTPQIRFVIIKIVVWTTVGHRAKFALVAVDEAFLDVLVLENSLEALLPRNF